MSRGRRSLCALQARPSGRDPAIPPALSSPSLFKITGAIQVQGFAGSGPASWLCDPRKPLQHSELQASCVRSGVWYELGMNFWQKDQAQNRCPGSVILSFQNPVPFCLCLITSRPESSPLSAPKKRSWRRPPGPPLTGPLVPQHPKCSLPRCLCTYCALGMGGLYYPPAPGLQLTLHDQPKLPLPRKPTPRGGPLFPARGAAVPHPPAPEGTCFA